MTALLATAWACIAAAADAAGPRAGIEAYAKSVSAEPGLVAYLRFEGDLRDAKGTAHGTARGGDPAFAPGPGGGRALDLERRGHVALGPAPELDVEATTIELWLRPAFDPSVPYNPCLIAKRRSSRQTRFSVHLWRDYSCLALWNGRKVVRFQPLGRRLRRGQWYHLAVTSAGADVRVYLDGLPCRRLDPPAGFALERRALPLQIGASAPEGAERFAGSLDEVALYDRALGARRIEAHMDAMGAKERLTLARIRAREARERAERARAAKERLAELMRDENLFAPGGTRVYEGAHLEAIRFPVGGIGAGTIQIDGRGRRAIWQIFNNFEAAHVPHGFLAIRIRPAAGRPVVRVLQTAAEGPIAGMEALRFRGEYPFAWLEFEDPAIPVKVAVEVFNPLIPLEAERSALPCAITTIAVENPGEDPVEVSLLAAQQNAVGFTGKGKIEGRAWAGYGRNRNALLREAGAAILHMTAEIPETAPGFGDMALAAFAEEVTGTASWETLEALAADLRDDGRLTGPDAAGPTPAGSTVDGALALPLKLRAGERRAVTFALAWYFPNARHGGPQGWGGRGNRYARIWKSALDGARRLRREIAELRGLTRRYHDALYASNLPRWLLDRLSSQIVVLRSPTCFWTEDGYFGGWEGCSPSSGCCHGNCSHVWHYAQAHARLFPSIARAMREEELRSQGPDGAVPHRQPRSAPAFDGQCGTILGAYREHLMSTDGTWLAKHWPRIEKAMDFIIATWDRDEDGVLAGPQWNTLDGALGGSTSWLGTLYLAALSAAERMARLEGHGKAADRYARIRRSGAERQDETLWNGEYYIQIPDPEPREDYGTGCHIDQLLGQWWAHQLDLGWLYPPERVRKALGSLFRYSFRPYLRGYPQRPRKFVDDDDPGMQMVTWPKGGRPAKCIKYADEVMTGFEYAAAAEMVYAGLLREGFTVTRAVAIRYDGRARTGLTTSRYASWGYSGNPFCDDECGKFYARAMSVWSMLLACQGFVYDGPAGRIGFAPIWRPEDHTSFFTAAEGWGVFAQRREARRQRERIDVRYGRLEVRTLVFRLSQGAMPARVAVAIEGRPLEVARTKAGERLEIELASPAVVEAGRALTVQIAW